MDTATGHDPRYPIGKYEAQDYSLALKEKWLKDLAFLPADLEIAIENLDEYQLDTPYRYGGWTVKQLIHHVADSHMNAYIRFKLGMSEENPTINPYEEKDWAVMEDVYTVPVNVSTTLLHALHQRWVAAVKNLNETQFARTVYHPQHQKNMSLWHLLGLYAWHGRHHLAHITALRQQQNW